MVACILIDKLKLSRWPVIGKVRRELGFYCYLYSLTHSFTHTDSIVAYASLSKEAVSYKNEFIIWKSKLLVTSKINIKIDSFWTFNLLATFLTLDTSRADQISLEHDT